MKLVLAWLTVLGLTAITASSCSINHRTGEFECTKQADCSGGRTCTGGYCVLPGGTVDAPKGDGPTTDGQIDGNNNVCPQQCTTCDFGSHTCKIDCAVTSCNAQVVCPVGWNCDVACSVTNSCRNGVTCNGPNACTITCSGANSCRTLECGTGKCDVVCSGSMSCRGVACGNSCGCDVKCGGTAACEGVACTSFQCDTGLGCSSTLNASCDTCP
ncbi:MAG: hypothetical protein IPQ07_14965 [Myxococcales bacterium]|nr:hypothetical protein [Myxococcales bacterium]